MSDERIRYVLSAVDETRPAFASVRSNLEGMARSLRTLTGLGGGLFGAVVLNEARQVGGAILEARIQSEKLGIVLSQGVGRGNVAREIGFIRGEADRLGLAFDSTAASYAKFAAASRGTALEGQQTRDVFVGIAQASAALGLSSEETAGALTAVQQMISKGKVSAEELRGQLGERLPGAFQIAARSIGVTTSELDRMLQAGELLAADFLPQFARQLQLEFAGAAEQAAQSTQASVNKLSTAWGGLKRTLGEGVAGDAIKLGIDQTTIAVDNLAKATKRAEQNSGGWLENMLELTRLLPGIGPLLARTIGDAAVDRDRLGFDSSGQDSILARRAGERGPGVTADTVSGLRRLDNAQGAAFNASAAAEVRKLLEQFRTPEQKLEAQIAELRRLGSLTGTDVSGAIAEARRRAAGATVDMAKAYRELDEAVRAADMKDRLEQEEKAARDAADAFREYNELLGAIAGNEREGAEKALSPDREGWERVAEILREIRKIDPKTKGQDAALNVANELLNSGAISFDEYEKLGSKILELKDPIREVGNASKEIFAPIGSALEDALVNLRDIGDIAKGLAQDITRVLIRQQITGPLGEFVSASGAGKSTAGIGSGTLFGSLLEWWRGTGSPARASGGPIAAGMPYLVGERGPELVVPKAAGTVMPAGSFGGAITVVPQLSVTDSMPRSQVLDLLADLERRVYDSVEASMNRNGAFARA